MVEKPYCRLDYYSLSLIERAPAMLGIDFGLLLVDGNGKSDAFKDTIDHVWLQDVYTVATKSSDFVMFEYRSTEGQNIGWVGIGNDESR